MRQQQVGSALKAIGATALTIALFAASSFAGTEKVLHDFNSTNGKYANGALVFDSLGNLYGVTSSGGHYGGGVAYMLSRNSSGTWVETILHNFGNTKNKDGAAPYNNLIFDSAGNLYGTTYAGGAASAGTVYELSPATGGKWTEAVLHSFAGGLNDGSTPEAGLLLDAAGNLYGTTFLGGTFTKGAAFELSPVSGGGWTEKLIWSFGNGTDGANPDGALISDTVGNLYSTTANGGAKNFGTVFELSSSGGSWTETILHNFGTFHDGLYPFSTLVFDAVGNLYGTTTGGGTKGYGTVFELSPASGGTWTETILHNFASGSDGYQPDAEQLVFDAAGNLYGTTLQGGAHSLGIVFKLTPSSTGHWTETLMHAFTGTGDGGGPFAGVILDSAGNLYGATNGGGPTGVGVIYEITP
jgi:uncharacterized repeat protein (TIGR03803 family)